MIHITITSDTPPKKYAFKALPLCIGSCHADIIFNDLEPEHFKILEENGHLIIINLANDPFATLNDLPFGKKKLKNHDVLKVNSHLLQFEIELKAKSHFPIDKIKAAPEPSPAKKLEVIDLEALFREVENLENQEDDQPLVKLEPKAEPTLIHEAKEIITERPKPSSQHPHQHHNSVIEAEDEIEPLREKKETKPVEVPKNRSLLPSLAAILLLICSVIGFAIAYLKVDDKSFREQIIAAEGVADFSMALAYAQVNHITPQKQNWFDPDFLKNNLTSVLSSEYPSFANIDNLGQFQNCPYILRIYTNTDLKQFLVIAQPEPTLLHWLFPRPAIAIDSKTMEMRKISNIKALNRLLANPNVLDSSQAAEISYLVRQGELIELSSFSNNQGFAAPKTLALVRPGSENLIYNAPRYFHFTEVLLTKSLSLLQMLGSSYEVTRLQQQILDLSQFSNLVLYSSQGFQKALQAQKALAMLVPNHPFLIAYLTLNKEGYITNSHLLPSDEQPDFIANSAPSPYSSIIGSLSNMTKLTGMTEIADAAAEVAQKQSHVINGEVDPHHPLFLRLASMTLERQRALKAISDRMKVLLNQHDDGKTEAFAENFSKLLSWYLQVDQQRQEKLMQELKTLYQEYSSMPLSQFIEYVKASGLRSIAKESLSQISNEADYIAVTPEQIAFHFQKIQGAKSFSELNKVVIKAVALLNLNQIPDHEKLIRYQNEMRLRTLQQLSKFMLSPTSRLASSEFTENNRMILEGLLKAAWVTDHDETAFYLNEFDLLIPEN